MAYSYNEFNKSINRNAIRAGQNPKVSQYKVNKATGNAGFGNNIKAERGPRPSVDDVQRKTGGGAKQTSKPKPKAPGAIRKLLGSAVKTGKVITGPVGMGVSAALTPSAIADDDESGYEATQNFQQVNQTPEQIEAQEQYEANNPPQEQTGNNTGNTFEQDVANSTDVSNIPAVQDAETLRRAQDPTHHTARTDFNDADVEYDMSNPGEVTGTVTDSRGNSGTMTAPESLMSSERGTMSTYSASDMLKDPDAKHLARQAAAGQISTAQYNAGLRSLRKEQEAKEAQNNSPSNDIMSKIKRLESELSRPGRGLNQSLSDMLMESRNRKVKRKQLDSLYGLQKQQSSLEAQSQAQQNRLASQESVAGYNASKADARDLRKAQRQDDKEERRIYEFEVGRADDVVKANRARRKETQATAQERLDKDTGVYSKEADRKIESGKLDDDDRPFYIANMQSKGFTGDGDYFETPEGKVARRDIATKYLDMVKSERGIWDGVKNWLGFGNKDLTVDDIYNLDFSKLDFNDSGEGLMALLPVGATRVNAPGKTSNYVYNYSMPDNFKIMLKRLIASDKKKAKNSDLRNSNGL